jgi:hypothetical protein
VAVALGLPRDVARLVELVVLALALFVLFEVINPGKPDVHTAVTAPAVSHHAPPSKGAARNGGH